MYYIRVLKRPAIKQPSLPKNKSSNKDSSKQNVGKNGLQLDSLITITTDLGELFYPYDVDVHATLELDSSLVRSKSNDESKHRSKRVKASHSIPFNAKAQWTAGMRELPLSIPLPIDGKLSDESTWTLTIQTNEPHAIFKGGQMIMPPVLGLTVARDTSIEPLDDPWYRRCIPLQQHNATKHPTPGTPKAEETDRRTRFLINEAPPHSASDIASHVWDAGVAAAAFMPAFVLPYSNSSHSMAPPSQLHARMQEVFSPERFHKHPFNIVELGCGCAPLTGALMAVVNNMSSRLGDHKASEDTSMPRSKEPDINITLSDLLDAQETVETNLALFYSHSTPHPAFSINTSFLALDWETVAAAPPSDPTANIPTELRDKKIDLIMASDVTYNPDTSPALVQTLSALCQASCQALINRKKECREADEGGREPLIFLARKFRHRDEEVFWREMEKERFQKMEECRIWCPITREAEVDEEDMGEWVECCVFGRQPGERY